MTDSQEPPNLGWVPATIEHDVIRTPYTTFSCNILLYWTEEIRKSVFHLQANCSCSAIQAKFVAGETSVSSDLAGWFPSSC